jgi:hypothetical protein
MAYTFDTLAVNGPSEDGVIEVSLNRPKQLNAMVCKLFVPSVL